MQPSRHALIERPSPGPETAPMPIIVTDEPADVPAWSGDSWFDTGAPPRVWTSDHWFASDGPA